MRKAINIIAISVVALVIIGAFWINESNYRGAGGGVKGPVDADFQPGGTVTLDLSAGEYIIRGSSDSKIRVRYTYSDYVKDTASINLKTDGNKATIAVDGPSSEFRCEIDVPQHTNLAGKLSAGILRVSDVEGDKDFESRAGLMKIDVGDASMYKTVEASVTSGNLQARPWHTHKPGLFRSFNHYGSGQYALRAHVTAGNLIISESDAEDVRRDREPRRPIPPTPPRREPTE
ncbi:MAG TPA: hypothetical protein VEB03_01705 [Candidatus Nanoarchaeia archaeon]|nr:hypothetical protein [Candidatus Nanoarchaeia archaeon]